MWRFDVLRLFRRISLLSWMPRLIRSRFRRVNRGKWVLLTLPPTSTMAFQSGWTLSLDPDDTTITSFVTLSGTLLTWTPPVPDLDTDRLYSILLVLTHPTDPAVEVCAFVFLSVPAMSLVVTRMAGNPRSQWTTGVDVQSQPE